MAPLDTLDPLDLSNFVIYALIWTVTFLVTFVQYAKSGFYYRRYLYETLFKVNEAAKRHVSKSTGVRKHIVNPVSGWGPWILYHLHLVSHLMHFIMAAFLFVALALWLSQLWGHIMAPAPMSVYVNIGWVYACYFMYLLVVLADNFLVSWYSSLELWARVGGIIGLALNLVLALAAYAFYWAWVYDYNTTQMAWAGGLLTVWTLLYIAKFIVELLIVIALWHLPGTYISGTPLHKDKQ